MIGHSIRTIRGVVRSLRIYYGYNAMLGESHALVHPDWVGVDAIATWLAALPHDANSGDVYARLP